MSFWSGATFRKSLNLLQGDKLSAPKNLTGYSGELLIRDKPNSSTVLHSVGVTVFAPTVATTLSAAAASGDTTVTLSSPTGFVVDQSIAIGSELATIDSIAGSTLTLVTPLASDHANAVSVFVPPTRNIELLVSATDTATFTWKAGAYDLTITESGGDTTALLYGKVTVHGV